MYVQQSKIITMPKTLTPETGLKKLLTLLLLLIISPIIVSLGVKALRIYTESPQSLIAYTLITIGGIMILFTVYYGFKTFKTILDIIFKQ